MKLLTVESSDSSRDRYQEVCYFVIICIMININSTTESIKWDNQKSMNETIKNRVVTCESQQEKDAGNKYHDLGSSVANYTQANNYKHSLYLCGRINYLMAIIIII